MYLSTPEDFLRTTSCFSGNFEQQAGFTSGGRPSQNTAQTQATIPLKMAATATFSYMKKHLIKQTVRIEKSEKKSN